MRAVTKYLVLPGRFIMLRAKERTYLLLHRKPLVPLQQSPLKYLLQRGRDEGFMLYLDITRPAFEILLSAFNRVWQRKRTRIGQQRRQP